MSTRASTIANGVDIEAVRRAAMAEAHGMPDALSGPLLVAIGRLDWEKGFSELLSAVASIRDRFPTIRLVICGEGRERSALESRVHALGLGGNVSLPGHLENPMPLLRRATAFVSSSVQEGFALTVAEAMALGVPVISTPVSGAASVLQNGRTAFLTAGFSGDAIARTLAAALSDEASLGRVAAAGRQYAETQLDVRRTVGAYEALYRSAVL
jgi:glycosyltransferase involved in cell wall biosynthesis